MHTRLIVDENGKSHYSVLVRIGLVGIQYAHMVTITRISTPMKQETMSMMAISICRQRSYYIWERTDPG